MIGWHSNKDTSSAEDFMPSLTFGGGVQNVVGNYIED